MSDWETRIGLAAANCDFARDWDGPWQHKRDRLDELHSEIDQLLDERYP